MPQPVFKTVEMEATGEGWVGCFWLNRTVLGVDSTPLGWRSAQRRSEQRPGLGGDGPTPNDPGDADTGGNELQNAPTLTGSALVGAKHKITGTLDSAPGGYRINLYANLPGDAEPEGRTLVGTAVASAKTGVATFTVTISQLPAGTKLTATATSKSGETSEFSATLTL